jgi:dihydrofolate synthase/folylpolyglutamate synthase
LLRLGHEFGYRATRDSWRFWGPMGEKSGLVYPALRGSIQLQNASAALAALDALRERLPVSVEQACQGMASVSLPGRFQVLPGRPVVVLDVGHNPQAAAVLGDNLAAMGLCRKTWAVFGMLLDKDIAGVIDQLANRVDYWMVCALPPPRGSSAAQLAQALRRAGVTAVREFENPAAAYAAARGEADESDRILAFGSFYTVAGVIAALDGSKLKA